MSVLGTIRLNPERKRWEITTLPHVMMRLKRVFGKISKSAQTRLELSDTAENARELLWFIERYPLKVEDPDYLTMRAAEHKERENIVEQLLARRRDLPAFELAIPAREYQKEAAALVLATGGLLLADELGLGKTISAICTLCEPRALPALVVTMTHLPAQWEAEIKRFAPNLTTHILKNGDLYDLTRIRGPRGAQLPLSGAVPDVIITSYSKLSKWAGTLAPVVRSTIFDECAELRRNESAKYEAAKHIAESVSYRTGLSATPIYNFGGEFHNVISCLRPDVLGTAEEFTREWCSNVSVEDISKGNIADPKAFGHYLRSQGIMLRRTRANVGRELPALSKIVQTIESNVAALDKVSATCAELARLILREGESKKGEKMMASEEFSNVLRQATGIAKAPYVADFVRMLVEQDEPVLLYGWHRAVYDIWNDKLADLKPVMFTGSESAKQKEAAKQEFMSGKSKVLIMSLRSGAGLDGLQKVCSTVVNGELDWSPSAHKQCDGRVHRDGQEKPVFSYYLISDFGVDPFISDVLQLKNAQLEGVRDPDAELVTSLSVDPKHVKKLAERWLEQQKKKGRAA